MHALQKQYYFLMSQTVARRDGWETEPEASPKQCQCFPEPSQLASNAKAKSINNQHLLYENKSEYELNAMC